MSIYSLLHACSLTHALVHARPAVLSMFVYLRCIKDWMDTKNTFHIISLERKMIWLFDVISNHFSTGHTHFPTQSHAHTFLKCLYPQSIPTELLICRSNCSPFFSWIQVSLSSTGFLVREWVTAWEFLRNVENRLQTYARTQFCFSTPYYCTSNPTIHSSMCCSSFISVALTCLLFLQIGNTLRNSRDAWQQ